MIGHQPKSLGAICTLRSIPERCNLAQSNGEWPGSRITFFLFLDISDGTVPLDFGRVKPFPAATPDAPMPAATNLERAVPFGFCLRTDAAEGGDGETWGIVA